jgi:hypothetical protein
VCLFWLTPRAIEIEESFENYQSRMKKSGNPKNTGKKNAMNLTMQVNCPNLWPTVRVSSANGASQKEIEQGNPKRRLETEVQLKKWATPNTLDYINVVRKPEERSEKAKKGGCSNLREQVHLPENWPTPRATDATGGPVLTEATEKGFRSYRHESGKWFGAKLKDAVQTWPTPSARDHKGGSGTIVEDDGKFYRISNTTKTRFGARLDAVVEHLEKWPTPSAHEARLGYQDRSDPTKKGTQESLTTVAVNKAGGRKKCKGHLNPDWVEQLMGLPPGWTALDGTSNKWQYGWHDGSWEQDIPRVVESCDDRVDRIRLLGNGVVPATAARAWQVLTA